MFRAVRESHQDLFKLSGSAFHHSKLEIVARLPWLAVENVLIEPGEDR
jgi:hypothetical protein